MHLYKVSFQPHAPCFLSHDMTLCPRKQIPSTFTFYHTPYLSSTTHPHDKPSAPVTSPVSRPSLTACPHAARPRDPYPIQHANRFDQSGTLAARLSNKPVSVFAFSATGPGMPVFHASHGLGVMVWKRAMGMFRGRVFGAWMGGLDFGGWMGREKSGVGSL